jgi:hypothetical protein
MRIGAGESVELLMFHARVQEAIAATGTIFPHGIKGGQFTNIVPDGT